MSTAESRKKVKKRYKAFYLTDDTIDKLDILVDVYQMKPSEVLKMLIDTRRKECESVYQQIQGARKGVL